MNLGHIEPLGEGHLQAKHLGNEFGSNPNPLFQNKQMCKNTSSFKVLETAAVVCFSSKTAVLDFMRSAGPEIEVNTAVFLSNDGNLSEVPSMDKVTKGNKIETAMYIYIYIL